MQCALKTTLGLIVRPGESKAAVRLPDYSSAELSGFPIQRFHEQVKVFAWCVHQLEALHLKRHHVQLKQIAAREINAGEIHQREVIEKFLVTADAFVVIQEVSTSIQNEAIAIDFYCNRVMRGMAVDNGNTCILDEFVGEAAVLLGNFESPIRPPMDGQDNDVTCPSQAPHSPATAQRLRRRDPSAGTPLESHSWRPRTQERHLSPTRPKTPGCDLLRKDPRRLVRSLDRCQARLPLTRSADAPDFPACRPAQQAPNRKYGCWRAHSSRYLQTRDRRRSGLIR